MLKQQYSLQSPHKTGLIQQVANVRPHDIRPVDRKPRSAFGTEQTSSCGSETVATLDVISTLIHAIDLAIKGTAARTLRSCILGMNIGRRVGLNQQDACNLYYSLLLKDAGCLSFGDPDQLVTCKDCVCEKIVARSEASERVVRRLGLDADVAQAVRYLDEHWKGLGSPHGLCYGQIPVLSQICNIAKTLEVFERTENRDAAVAIVEARSRTWFDPELVATVSALRRSRKLWTDYDSSGELFAIVSSLEPRPFVASCEDLTMDDACYAIAELIDSRSCSTFMHSWQVAHIAERIGRRVGVSPEELRILRRAALLHDIGELGVPEHVLLTTGNLSPDQWAVVKMHPQHTHDVLSFLPGFERAAEVASCHHERLDGSGYPNQRGADEICLLSRILAVADVYDALTSARPFRPCHSHEAALNIIEKDTPHLLDRTCYEALRASLSHDPVRLRPRLVRREGPTG